MASHVQYRRQRPWHSLCEVQKCSIEHVISIEVPEQELLKRLSGRRQIEGRHDDTDEAVRHRLEVYHRATAPLIDYYRQSGLLRSIQGLALLTRFFNALQQFCDMI